MNNSDDNIKRIISLMQTDNSVDAPADALKWSKNLFRTRAAEPKATLIEKVLAVLRMDLAPNKAVFGERSASAGQARQMLFEAGESSIDLRISEEGEGFTVRGQILGAGFANASVKLGGLETVTNELSEFKFENIQGGSYDLILRAADREIIIEAIELG